MYSILKTAKPLALVSLVVLSACSTASAVPNDVESGTYQDLPLHSLASEVRDCMSNYENADYPFWVPDEAMASSVGYGVSEESRQKLEGLSSALSVSEQDCSAQQERVESINFAIASSQTGDVYKELSRNWSSCMQDNGFDNLDDLTSRKHSLVNAFYGSAPSETFGETLSRADSAVANEIEMALADRACHSQVVFPAIPSLAEEQAALLAEAPADQINILRGDQ